jgi:hypothetical protein
MSNLAGYSFKTGLDVIIAHDPLEILVVKKVSMRSRHRSLGFLERQFRGRNAPFKTENDSKASRKIIIINHFPWSDPARSAVSLASPNLLIRKKPVPGARVRVYMALPEVFRGVSYEDAE